jgi:pimeloyl-ACP methyl ester carboxylesterase/DNA-binding CsgD family transcriptional regulator
VNPGGRGAGNTQSALTREENGCSSTYPQNHRSMIRSDLRGYRIFVPAAYNFPLESEANVPIVGIGAPVQLRQHVHYAKAPDGTRLAWAVSGAGPPLVKAANWLTHLEYEWDSPVWRHWIQFFSEHFQLIRYDERGCGMSDWHAGSLSLAQWTTDLETVIDTANPGHPFTLLGISQGAAACIQYAVLHPERVARMILYGGYVHGAFKRGIPNSAATYRAMIDLARIAWSESNPAFRQVFTSRFLPGGTPEQLQWFNNLCVKSTVGEVAAQLFEARAVLDITELLPHVRVPTLVLHARDDEVVQFSEGRLLASGIPNAEFVELDSRNHILLEHEPAWSRFREAVLSFMNAEVDTYAGAFAALSIRERDVLALIAAGLSNTQIAENLEIGEKTVRNHASNLFDKLGVRSRAQAIVFAHAHGFKHTRQDAGSPRAHKPGG